LEECHWVDGPLNTSCELLLLIYSANAEYIRMGDVIVDVPGGSNNHNYANVTLIVELARLHGVNAVWAGWGHASENPLLPDTLHKSNPPIKFIGPSGPPMRALGDKIGSTIIAQSAGVPCIAWNGEHVKAEYDKLTGSLPEKAFEDATITNAVEAQEAAARIGFPIMIKASEGGGGKGIRRVDKLDDVANAFRQVCGEVPGSPIFIMKLSANSRHLEVQLLADEYGDAVALNGRDCSVQRRHQKIIEEGPPVAAHPDAWMQMEKAAVALAKAVQYANAGTVEYLYSESEAKFYFLELNPRLQVEHPVTEMITRVNLPAAQLQVAMGIPLHNIPEIRELYGKHRFEDDPYAETSKIAFESTPRVAPYGHCIAVRITAENAEAGFKPTSGGIQELNFRSTPNVWGYFSMDSSGSIHEFADSQFGHLFASGPDREQARRNMVLALKELSIRGDISTTVDYISKLIELEDFVSNKIHTGWLDGIIKDNVDGMGAAEGFLKHRTSVNIQSLSDHMYVILGAAVSAFDLCTSGEKRFLELLDKGQLPPRSLLKMKHVIELILNGVKYKLCCTRSGQNSLSITADDECMGAATTNVRLLSDGGYLIDVCGNSHVAYLTSKGDAATSMRMNIAGKNVVFSPDYDPTALRTDVAGKLVKKLKSDGSRVKKGEPYGEIEVMKMFLPLKVEESGVLLWNVNEGAAISAGDLLATLELDNPDNVAKVSLFTGVLNVPTSPTAEKSINETTPHLMLRAALERLDDAMSGFLLSSDAIERALANIASAVTRPTLPVLEIKEQLAVLSGRIPSVLSESIVSLLGEYTTSCELQAGSGVELR
jgi:acetyl-CoA carboxylase / biotin carboxylase 1